MTCVSNFKLTNSKNLNCQHFESLEIAHEFNVNKHLSKHGPILRLMILKRCLVWGSLQFEHSMIVPKFWWKSEFTLIITLLHIIAHTWVEFKSKIPNFLFQNLDINADKIVWQILMNNSNQCHRCLQLCLYCHNSSKTYLNLYISLSPQWMVAKRFSSRKM